MAEKEALLMVLLHRRSLLEASHHHKYLHQQMKEKGLVYPESLCPPPLWLWSIMSRTTSLRNSKKD